MLSASWVRNRVHIMGMSLELKNLNELGSGRQEYTRRVPKAVLHVIGKGEVSRTFAAQTPAAIVREYSRVSAEIERLFADAKRKLQDPSKLTPRETAEVAWEDAERLLAAGVVGAKDEDEAQELLAESLILVGASPAIYRAMS